MNPESNQDWAALCEKQAKYTGIEASLTELEARINRSRSVASDPEVPDFAVLQEQLAELDRDLKALFQAHPEWRGDKKSLSTPFGTISSREVTELQVANAAMTIRLIELKALEDNTVNPGQFIRTEKSLNLEALEALKDDQLAQFGIKRVTTDRISIKSTNLTPAQLAKLAAKESTNQ